MFFFGYLTHEIDFFKKMNGNKKWKRNVFLLNCFSIKTRFALLILQQEHRRIADKSHQSQSWNRENLLISTKMQIVFYVWIEWIHFEIRHVRELTICSILFLDQNEKKFFQILNIIHICILKPNERENRHASEEIVHDGKKRKGLKKRILNNNNNNNNEPTGSPVQIRKEELK